MLSSLIEDPSTHDVTFKTSDGGDVSVHIGGNWFTSVPCYVVWEGY